MLVAGAIAEAASSLAVSAAERCAAVSVIDRNELTISVELPPEDEKRSEWVLWLDDYSNQVGRGHLKKMAQIETVKYRGAKPGKHHIGLVILAADGHMADVCWVGAHVNESMLGFWLDKIWGPATGASIALLTVFVARWVDEKIVARRRVAECMARMKVDIKNAIRNIGDGLADGGNLEFISRDENEWVKLAYQDVRRAGVVDEFRRIWGEWVDRTNRAPGVRDHYKQQLKELYERVCRT